MISLFVEMSENKTNQKIKTNKQKPEEEYGMAGKRDKEASHDLSDYKK